MPAVFEIGNSLREARLRQELELRGGRARHEDPRQVPPRARGGAVRPPARRRRTSRASSALRRLPRPRRPALRRRVQLALRRRRGGAPLGRGACRASRRRAERAARVERRRCSRSRDRARHRARDRGLALRRRPSETVPRARASTRTTSDGRRAPTPQAAETARLDASRATGATRALVVRRAARIGRPALQRHARARPDRSVHGQRALGPGSVARRTCS